jgi:hypothetical protein
VAWLSQLLGVKSQLGVFDSVSDSLFSFSLISIAKIRNREETLKLSTTGPAKPEQHGAATMGLPWVSGRQASGLLFNHQLGSSPCRPALDAEVGLVATPDCPCTQHRGEGFREAAVSSFSPVQSCSLLPLSLCGQRGPRVGCIALN